MLRKAFIIFNTIFAKKISCREKKDSEVHCLESTKDGEAENLGGIEKENEELRETLVKLKNHYAKVCVI